MLLNTICLLVKRESPKGEISEVLLARKKTGFGAGKIVGVGGTVEADETVFQAAVREVKEELDVDIRQKDLQRAAKLTFLFPAKPEWDRVVYVYLVERWKGIPKPSREIDPFWLKLEDIPYGEMWADSAEWLPEIFSGRQILGRFAFEQDNETLAWIEIQDDQDFLWPQLKSLPYFRALLRSVEASYYQDLDLPQPILDLGSGDGHFASIAFDFQIEVGLDPWWEPLVDSQRYPQSYDGLVQADGAVMPFPDEHFASALSNSVLEHIPHIDAVLAETARVLKPGAPFVFCCPNQDYYHQLSLPGMLRALGLKGMASAYQDWFMRMSRTEHADPVAVWQDRLEQAGFALERSWNYFSPQSLHVLEWGHFLGAPSLLPMKLFKRWIISPSRWNLWLTEKLVRPYAKTEPRPDGTYTFFIARKR
jgi:8-oxo-dGTP pyrophosphatase MutT (NUDIX family)